MIRAQAAALVASSIAHAPSVCQWSCQVLKLGPGVEQRLLAMFRTRILPVAQKSLRLWKQGDARRWGPLYAAWHSALGHARARTRTWMLFGASVALCTGAAGMSNTAGSNRHACFMQAKGTSARHTME